MKYLCFNDGYAFLIAIRSECVRGYCDLAEQMSMFTRYLIPLQRKGIRNKERENDATKPFGFSDRSITISREYKCLREQPTDAVQFGVGPALPFNLVASSLLISFHRPAPTIPNLCNFSFRSCPSI